MDLEKQSELSVLRPDTSSFVVPTFATKVTEYLCLGWFFVLQIIFDFLSSLFCNFLNIFQKGLLS